MANVHILLIFLMALSCKFIGSKMPNKEKPKLAKERCEKMKMDPFFCNHLVVNKPWRVYQMWQPKNCCQECIPGDIYFKNISPEIIKRIRSNMQCHIEPEPEWKDAALLLITGKARHEIALIGDPRVGSFIGVPNVIHKEPIQLEPPVMPPKEWFIKLYCDGKYLIIVDCTSGTVWLFGRPNAPPTSQIIADFGKELELGRGANCSY